MEIIEVRREGEYFLNYIPKYNKYIIGDNNGPINIGRVNIINLPTQEFKDFIKDYKTNRRWEY